MSERALCVDLDGTFINTDMMYESFVRVVKTRPWLLLAMPFWLLQGKHKLKRELALRCRVDFSVLPYNSRAVEYIRQQREKGRECVLVTGSNERLANGIAEHCQIFDRVMASDNTVNLTGKNKAAVLCEEYGSRNFDYMGNSHVDKVVWREAFCAITANAPKAVVADAKSAGVEHIDLAGAKSSLLVWLKAMRIHQWVKNALLFVPLLTSHHVFDVVAIWHCALAFIAFGLIASSTYFVNDLFDLDADRAHKSKCRRPFAAGTLSIKSGLLVGGVLLLVGAAISSLLPVGFQLCLLAYLVSTLCYSFVAKSIASLDVIFLAGLYTLRVIGGAFAIDVALSFWLLAFSMFIFLCLALAKRVAELVDLDGGKGSVAKGREYTTFDIPLLQMLGASCGYIAVLVIALYINSDEVVVLYQTPQILWLIAPLLLLWVTRLWMITARGYMDQDPIVWAVKDPETWITSAVAVLIIVAAKFLNF